MTIKQVTDDAETQLIDAYLPYLLDTDLVFAILVTWALTHHLKKFPFIAKHRSQAVKDRMTIIAAFCLGFVVTFAFKYTNPEDMTAFKVAFIVAAINPYLYKGLVIVLGKFFPSVKTALSNKK